MDRKERWIKNKMQILKTIIIYLLMMEKMDLTMKVPLISADGLEPNPKRF